jgi:hypothetical protein
LNLGKRHSCWGARDPPSWPKIAKIGKNSQFAGPVGHEQINIFAQFNLVNLLALPELQFGLFGLSWKKILPELEISIFGLLPFMVVYQYFLIRVLGLKCVSGSPMSIQHFRSDQNDVQPLRNCEKPTVHDLISLRVFVLGPCQEESSLFDSIPEPPEHNKKRFCRFSAQLSQYLKSNTDFNPKDFYWRKRTVSRGDHQIDGMHSAQPLRKQPRPAKRGASSPNNLPALSRGVPGSQMLNEIMTLSCALLRQIWRVLVTLSRVARIT